MFNKVLEHVLTKVCNTKLDDWDLKILVVLLAYCTTLKILARHTPFNLVYGKEEVMPMEYIVPSLCIAASTCIDDESTLEERQTQLVHLEEDRFVAGFHRRVEKD